MTGWRLRIGITLLALVAIGLIHHETAASLARTWTNSATYTHGWLILPFSAWLIWRQRRAIAVIRPRIWWPALLAVAALELIWIAGTIAGVAAAQHAVLIALIPATVFLLLGPSVGRALAFPLGYLIFAIPWGDGLVPILQDVTAHMAVYLLELVGVPVFFEGRLISIPAGNFEVAEACAGIRYLIAALALGTLYAYLVYDGLWRRALFIVSAAIVPVVANGLRAWGIIMLASLSDMRIAVGVDHLIYGWIFFGVVMFLLFWVGSFWRDSEREPANAALAGSGSTVRERPRTPLAAALTLVALTVMASMLPDWSARAQPVPATRVHLPPSGSDWNARSGDAENWYTGFKGADDVGFRHYAKADGDDTVALLVIHYRREAQGAELITSSNRLRSAGWNWLGGGEQIVPAGDRTRDVRELRLTRPDGHRLIWFWYEIGGWQTTSPMLAKMMAAVNRLTGRRGDATWVALDTGYTMQTAEARARLTAFIADHPRVLEPGSLLKEQ